MLTRTIYVYPDQALLVSLVMNGIILWGTARILRQPAGKWRVFAGALTGAVYSFFAAFPHLQFLHGFWIKVLFSAVIVAVTFIPLPFRRFMVTIAGFYVTTFVLVGTIIGVQNLINSDYRLSMAAHGLWRLLTDYFWLGLGAGILLVITMARWGSAMFRKRALQDVLRIPLRVLFDQDEVEVEALIDTGNQLQDPLTNIPVVVVEYAALRHLLPPAVQLAFEKSADPDIMEVLQALATTPWSTRFRVIPFTSLGRQNGLLMGFRPDRLEIVKNDQTVKTDNVIVGIYTKELSPEGSYRALLHPDIIDNLPA